MGKKNTTRTIGNGSQCPKCHNIGGASVSRSSSIGYCSKHEFKCTVHTDLAYITEDGCAKCATTAEHTAQRLAKAAQAAAAKAAKSKK